VIAGALSFLLAEESSPQTTAALATAAVHSVAGIALLFVVFRTMSAHVPFWVALTAGIAAWAVVTIIVIAAHPSFAAGSALSIAALGFALRYSPRGTARCKSPCSLAREIAVRSTVACVLTLSVTTASPFLSPQLSGILIVFPFLSTTIVAMIHRNEGRQAACDTTSGVLKGQAGVAGFFTAVALAVQSLPLVLTYAIAILAAAAVLVLLTSIKDPRIGAICRSPGAICRSPDFMLDSGWPTTCQVDICHMGNSDARIRRSKSIRVAEQIS
jgi:hypothetical protein